MKLLAISGSLRAASTNSALLRVCAGLAPPEMNIVIYRGIGELAHFNPDLEANEPLAVTALRQQVAAADGLIIASPEYAHGVAGAMKNALDWLVGGSEIVGKLLMLINAAPRARHAYDALKETLNVMSAQVIASASITLPVPIHKMDEAGIAADAEIKEALQRALKDFAEAIHASGHDPLS